MNARYDMINCYVTRPGEPGRPAELLQLRRAPGEPLAGLWSIVRGKIEAGEKAWQAALRELQEETRLVPSEFYQLDTIDTFYLASDDSIWHVPGFCAVVGRDAIVHLNEEHDAYRWSNRTRIEEDFIWPGEREQLRELSREILDVGPAKQFLRIRTSK